MNEPSTAPAQNLSIQVLKGSELVSKGLGEKLIALDIENMRFYFEQLGATMPLEKRLAGLNHPSTVVVSAFHDDALIGYLEFCDDWDCPEDIYFSSIQIAPPFQHGSAFRELVQMSVRLLRERTWRKLKAGVHKSNHRMQKILEKLNFELSDPGTGKNSLIAVGGPSVLDSRLVKGLLRSSS